MNNNRWVINRVGLLNFWYYQNQIFQLADGKMLLRGTNGSGKSLTMQSLFPVLFDGDTSAYRLDSFGSRDRKMEDYLLGEKGVSTRDEGVGYLFLEVKREAREEYLTVGIGMHANRGGKLNKWFFAIENNQRVGIDMELYEELRKGEFTPLTKKKLRNRLEGKGKIFETQRAYKEFVNRRIFGFETIEQFDELIALLINLRSPKLSKEFRPSVIYGILRDSLPKLKDDELLTLSKTIEQLDGHRERLEDLDIELNELRKFSKSYGRWRDEFVGQIAQKWLTLVKDKRGLEKEKNRKEKENRQWDQELQEQKQWIQENDAQLKALVQSIQELNQHEGMDLVRRGQELQDQLAQTKEDLRKNQDHLTRKQQQLAAQKQQLEGQESELLEKEKDLEDLLDDNQQYLAYLRLDDLDKVYSQKMRTEITKEEFSYWKNQVQIKQKHFQQIVERLVQLSYREEQLVIADRELGSQQQIVDGLMRDLRQWQQTRQSEVERWKNELDKWQQAASFQMTSGEYGGVMHHMDQLQEDYLREEEIIAPLTNAYQQALQENQTETIPLVNEKRTHLKTIQEKENEIKEWQNQKMPKVDQRLSREMNRNSLTDKSYIPFYQSIDFLRGVSQEERNQLEGALYASGILDSLISEEGLHLSDDQQIIPDPKYYASTLADYLEVVPTVDLKLQAIVMDVLQSITVDEMDEKLPNLFKNGSYQIANLRGAMPAGYQASYIGVASQERYRQAMIATLEKEISELNQKIVELDERIAEKHQQHQKIMRDYQNRPSGSEVYEAIRQMEQIASSYQLQKEQLERKQVQVNELTNSIHEEKTNLHRMTAQNGLALEVEIYQDARQYADNYEQNLDEAYPNYIEMQGLRRTIVSGKQHELILQEEQEDLLFERSEWQSKMQRETRLVEDNLQQQQLIHVEELQAQLSAAIHEQRDREAAKEIANEKVTELTSSLAVNQNDLLRVNEEFLVTTNAEAHWQSLFKAETNFDDQLSFTEQAETQKQEPNVKKLKERESSVLTQFNYLADRLQNYQPQLLNANGIELSEEEELRLGDFGNYNNYKLPVFVVDGQRQTTFDLLERLTEQKMMLQDLLKQDDEQLFKTIILESVGNILRSRINQAMAWVDQMNQLLQSQKNSSGLSLSIQWKGIPSTSEQDLGTNRLVALMQKPTNLLSEADREAISRHFQERVYYAQEQVRENSEDQSTLFQAISQVLDYRDWFEFELKFKRSNEGYSAQALTDRRFNQFSGGEKAIAMYLPLFAAVYSRYLDAEDFCPRMITLDEAFAGIDDLNIAELFKACEQLGFNYVMNSQALFGDYPTVSKLMIYELLRPQNINLVTPIQYYWDGHQKHLLLEGVENE